MVKITGRTSSVPNSAHRLSLEKDESLRSGILTYLPVCYLLRIQQYPVNTTYNTCMREKEQGGLPPLFQKSASCSY